MDTMPGEFRHPHAVDDYIFASDVLQGGLVNGTSEDEESIPSIHLHNFEDPAFEGSKYVLTSPRSLEACARYNIKPVELLYKPLIELQDELFPQHVPIDTIYDIYEQTERERINKLVLCREARLRIITNEKEDPDCYIYVQDQPWKHRVRQSIESCHKMSGRSRYRPIAETQTSFSDDELDQDTYIIEEEPEVVPEKFFPEKVVPKIRMREIVNERPRRPMTRSVTFDFANLHCRRRTSSWKKQQGKAHREDPDGEEVNSGAYSDGEVKRRSTSDLSMSSSANTGMSRRSSLWSEAKPITDSSMRSKLRSATGARVNAKDQRILELMMKKREEAQRQQQLRETAQMAWEEEKVRSLKARSESSSRRSSYSEPRSKSQPRIRDRTRLLSTTDSSSNRTPRKSEVEDAKSCDKTPNSVSRVMLERERKALEKKRANLERKKSQEQRLAEQEREKALMNSQIKAKLEQDLRRAEKLKEAKEKEDSKQRKMKSYYVKKKQEEKLHQIRKQSEEEQEQLAAALDQKMAIAETNLQARQERRTDLEQRLELSRQNQKRMQDEMSNWHAELQNYRKMMDEKAKEQTRRQLEEKRAKAAEDLRYKKRLQQENMQRLLEQEDEWKNDVEATIAMKDARSKMIAIEKEELLKESRDLAQASQILREELRMAYSIDHMDKMSKRAELEARMQKPL